MKIVVLMHNFDTGGVERYFIDLMNYMFTKKGAEVHFYVHQNSGFMKSELASGIKVHSFEKCKFRRFLLEFLSEMWRQKPDVIFTGKNLLNCILGSMRLFLPRNTKLFLSQHSYMDLETDVYMSKAFTVLLYRFFYNMADCVFAVSKGIESFLKNELKVKKVCQIYNPVNLSKVKLMAQDGIGEKFLNMEYILFIGRLSPVKNIPLLIEAFSLIHRSHPELRLCIAGEGPEKESLLELAAEKNLSGKIIFMGNVEPSKYIAHSKMVVLPSFSESFSLTSVETLALGIPLVTTPTKGVSEIIDDSGYPYMLGTFNDPAELAEKIELCFSGTSDYDFSGRVGRFDINVIGEQYYNFFESARMS